MKTVKYKAARYNPKETIVLANKIIEECRYQLSPHGFCLLMGLCQSIDFQEELFPEIDIDINGLFKFFNLQESNGKKYEAVREAFVNISRNPLEIKVSNKRWSGIPWLAYSFDEEKSKYVNISFHPQIIPYLLAFKTTMGVKNYTKITPVNYTKLRNEISVWLYPFFKKWEGVNGKNDTIAIRQLSWLREKTYCEKKYPENKDFIKAINRAIDHINKFTDIQIVKLGKKTKTFIYSEDNKTIKSLKFIISKRKEVSKPVKTKKCDADHIAEIYKRHLDVTEMTLEIKEELLKQINGFEIYCKEKNCVIERVNNRYFICR